MALVSALYRLAPSEGAISKEEAARRLKLILHRLVTQHGAEEVRRRVRTAVLESHEEATRAWILLHLMDA
jgi:hypothetical protein